MKKQIEKLVELAGQYVEYGKAAKLPQTHNYLREEDKDLGISLLNVYFANDYRTQSVRFGDVEVCFYKDDINIPLNATSKSLEAVYNDAALFFTEDLEHQTKRLLEEDKRDRIRDLRNLEKKGRLMRKELKEQGLLTSKKK